MHHLQRGRITTETEMICGLTNMKLSSLVRRERDVFILLGNRFSSDSACMGRLCFTLTAHVVDKLYLDMLESRTR